MNMDDLFGGPVNIEYFKPAEFMGELIMMRATGAFGTKQIDGRDVNYAGAQVHILTGTLAGTVYEDAEIIHSVLYNQVKAFKDGKRFVLGRLTLGEKRGSKQAPVKLEDPTDADKNVARAYLTALADGKLATPAPAKVPATAGVASAAGSPFA